MFLFVLFSSILANVSANEEVEEILAYEPAKLSCSIAYVGPAAQERTVCSGSAVLKFNSGSSQNFRAGVTVSGISSCCATATSDALAKCREAYSRQTAAGTCVSTACSCVHYKIQH